MHLIYGRGRSLQSVFMEVPRGMAKILRKLKEMLKLTTNFGGFSGSWSEDGVQRKVAMQCNFWRDDNDVVTKPFK